MTYLLDINVLVAFRLAERPGYDRNLDNEGSVLGAINYHHENPIRRGLCKNILDWQ